MTHKQNRRLAGSAWVGVATGTLADSLLHGVLAGTALILAMYLFSDSLDNAEQ